MSLPLSIKFSTAVESWSVFTIVVRSMIRARDKLDNKARMPAYLRPPTLRKELLRNPPLAPL